MTSRAWFRLQRAFQVNGGSRYMINEPITQQQHALQTYMMMKQTPVGSKRQDLRVGALLHDIGHLLEGEPIDPSYGTNDYHELCGAKWLAYHNFPPSVYLPAMFHVDAKRYLCTKNSKYRDTLSRGSELSLELQGGKMSTGEMKTFEDMPFFEETMLLRQCDDSGKDVNLTDLPSFESLKDEVEGVLDE